MKKVENRNRRYAYMLYEFWKKDTELFPDDIIDSGSGFEKKPHSVVFVFDGSLEEVPNGKEEENFYRKTLNRCRGKSNFL